MKIKDIMEAYIPLKMLCKNRMPFDVALKLARLVREMDSFVSDYEESVRNFADSLGAKYDRVNGLLTLDSDSDREKLDEYIEGLKDQEVNLASEIPLLDIDELIKMGISVEPNALVNLIGFVIRE